MLVNVQVERDDLDILASVIRGSTVAYTNMLANVTALPAERRLWRSRLESLDRLKTATARAKDAPDADAQ